MLFTILAGWSFPLHAASSSGQEHDPQQRDEGDVENEETGGYQEVSQEPRFTGTSLGVDRKSVQERLEVLRKEAYDSIP